MSDTSGKVAWWRLGPLKWQFDIVRGAGIRQNVADEFERSPTTVIDNKNIRRRSSLNYSYGKIQIVPVDGTKQKRM